MTHVSIPFFYGLDSLPRAQAESDDVDVQHLAPVTYRTLWKTPWIVYDSI